MCYHLVVYMPLDCLDLLTNLQIYTSERLESLQYSTDYSTYKCNVLDLVKACDCVTAVYSTYQIVVIFCVITQYLCL